MTMIIAHTAGWKGFGVTKARAISGMVSALRDNEGSVADIRTVTLIEFRPEDYFGKQVNENNPEEWAKEITEVKISKSGINRLADIHEELEKEGNIVNGTQDWRVDYGDEDITYVIRSDNFIVGFDEHWDEAKKSLEEVNNWNDEEKYYIDEVEGDVELKFKEVK